MSCLLRTANVTFGCLQNFVRFRVRLAISQSRGAAQGCARKHSRPFSFLRSFIWMLDGMFTLALTRMPASTRQHNPLLCLDISTQRTTSRDFRPVFLCPFGNKKSLRNICVALHRTTMGIREALVTVRLKSSPIWTESGVTSWNLTSGGAMSYTS